MGKTCYVIIIKQSNATAITQLPFERYATIKIVNTETPEIIIVTL